MTALRPSLLLDRAPLDLPREAGTLLLCLLIATWLHLVFFIAWETLAGDGPGLFRIEMPTEAPPLEIVLTLGEEPAAPAPIPEAQPPEPAVPDEDTAPPPPESPPAAQPEEAGARAMEIAESLLQAQLRPEAAGEGDEQANPSPPVTVEPVAPRFKSYNTTVRGAVAANWLMPPEARANFQPGRLVVNCTIGRDGGLLRLVVDESTGNAILDHAGLEALRSAAPFSPFPPELAAFSQLDITIIFDYQARYLSRARSDQPIAE
ncbi:MAG: energy transducer TonB [Candidatus Adiutrix sp.]|jgi:TonB family protein|nr:energy transducer TonB [Candidatus Adiutrix sp.]